MDIRGNLIWCENCKRGATGIECEMEVHQEKKYPWFRITHSVPGCGLVFDAHHREFYKAGTKPPQMPNPFNPLHLPVY